MHKQFTSGTTGVPKGATLSHFGMVNSSILAGVRLGFDRERAILCTPLPFYHIFGVFYLIVCHWWTDNIKFVQNVGKSHIKFLRSHPLLHHLLVLQTKCLCLLIPKIRAVASVGPGGLGPPSPLVSYKLLILYRLCTQYNLSVQVRERFQGTSTSLTKIQDQYLNGIKNVAMLVKYLNNSWVKTSSFIVEGIVAKYVCRDGGGQHANRGPQCDPCCTKLNVQRRGHLACTTWWVLLFNLRLIFMFVLTDTWFFNLICLFHNQIRLNEHCGSNYSMPKLIIKYW